MCIQVKLHPLLHASTRYGILSTSQARARLPLRTDRRRSLCAFSEARLPPALYLVATPIGNLEDITLRALRVLRTADLIFCEDCRHTRKLLSHFQISTALESLHQHNEAKQSGRVISLLRQGQAVALVSDAGTPGISDPGSITIASAIAAECDVVPVPGPCAVVSGLIASGLSTSRFTFIGFLPSKPGLRRNELNKLRQTVTATMVFYVPPHKLSATLVDMQDILGGTRQCCVAREVTKKFEQFLRGSVDSVTAQIASEGVKGEVTLFVEGSTDQELSTNDVPQMTREERMAELLASGHGSSDASKILASEFKMRRKEAYAIALSLQT